MVIDTIERKYHSDMLDNIWINFTFSKNYYANFHEKWIQEVYSKYLFIL